MNVIDQINNSRTQLKKYLSNEWNTTSIQDYSNKESEKIYNMNTSKYSHLTSFGYATGCNFSVQHKYIPSHSLHVIYFGVFLDVYLV